MPLILKILSVGLILSPIGNFLISYHMSDISETMGLGEIFEILPLIPPIDWAWNGLIALSGVLILLRRKLSWLIAITSIFICTAINLYKFFTYTHVPFGWGYVALTFSTSMAAALVIFYFRYPYLDRRDRWVKVNRRSEVKLNVEIQGGPEGVLATDVSRQGARLKFTGPCAYSEGQLVNLNFGEYTIQARVIWVKADTAGVAFEKPSREFRKWLSRGKKHNS